MYASIYQKNLRKENEETDLIAQEGEDQSPQAKNEQTEETTNENNQQKKYNRNRYNDKRRFKSKNGRQQRGGGSVRGGHQKSSNYRNRNKDSKKPKDNRVFSENKSYYNASGQNRRHRGGRRKNFESYNKSSNDDIKPLDPNSPPFTPSQFYPPFEMFNSLSISNPNDQ